MMDYVYAFVDEAGYVKFYNKFLLVVSIILTSDKLEWINRRYHFYEDSEEVRREFLNLINLNAHKLKILLNTYFVSREERLKNVFKI